MTAIELVILIVVIGIISAFDICAVTICVSKTLDDKMKTKADIKLKTFKEEIKIIDESLSNCINAFISLAEKKNCNKCKEEPVSYDGYGNNKPVKPIPVKRDDLDSNLDLKQPKNWII